jgi:voltage-gated potassium channel
MKTQQGGILFPYMSSILLLLIVFTVFVIPIFPQALFHIIYPLCFTGIFLIAAWSLQKHRKHVTMATLALITILWISIFADLRVLTIIARITQILFFFFLVARLVLQIANTSTVTGKVIMDSIIGYLLMGLAFSTLVILVSFIAAGSYNFHTMTLADTEQLAPVSDYIYYTFITYTTTGYGDFLPLTPMAKSLAMLIGVSGQLYVAIIIAMLVGTFATTRNE